MCLTDRVFGSYGADNSTLALYLAVLQLNDSKLLSCSLAVYPIDTAITFYMNKLLHHTFSAFFFFRP